MLLNFQYLIFCNFPTFQPELNMQNQNRLMQPGPHLSQQVFTPFQTQMLPNGQPRTLDFSRAGQSSEPAPVMPIFQQQGSFPPPVSEFTSAQLPLARLTDKSDSVMANGKNCIMVRQILEIHVSLLVDQIFHLVARNYVAFKPFKMSL